MKPHSFHNLSETSTNKNTMAKITFPKRRKRLTNTGYSNPNLLCYTNRNPHYVGTAKKIASISNNRQYIEVYEGIQGVHFIRRKELACEGDYLFLAPTVQQAIKHLLSNPPTCMDRTTINHTLEALGYDGEQM